MSDPRSDPELFDLPGDSRPRRIFYAHGSRKDPRHSGRKPKFITHSCYVNSPTPSIAKRVATQEMRLHRCRLDFIHEISWHEYARILHRSGFTVSGI